MLYFYELFLKVAVYNSSKSENILTQLDIEFGEHSYVFLYVLFVRNLWFRYVFFFHLFSIIHSYTRTRRRDCRIAIDNNNHILFLCNGRSEQNTCCSYFYYPNASRYRYKPLKCFIYSSYAINHANIDTNRQIQLLQFRL